MHTTPIRQPGRNKFSPIPPAKKMLALADKIVRKSPDERVFAWGGIAWYARVTSDGHVHNLRLANKNEAKILGRIH